MGDKCTLKVGESSLSSGALLPCFQRATCRLPTHPDPAVGSLCKNGPSYLRDSPVELWKRLSNTNDTLKVLCRCRRCVQLWRGAVGDCHAGAPGAGATAGGSPPAPPCSDQTHLRQAQALLLASFDSQEQQRCNKHRGCGERCPPPLRGASRLPRRCGT